MHEAALWGEDVNFTHEHPLYQEVCRRQGINHGAYWYSVEICKYFIPTIKTERPWVTVGYSNQVYDHSIVFIHSNLNPKIYRYLARAEDLILVCSWPFIMDEVRQWGKPVFLPMSVDTEYVKQFRREKDRGTCYAGRMEKCTSRLKPQPIDFISELPRDELLAEMARYRNVYAMDRVAIEAKVLGCTVLQYDKRFPDTKFWQVLDSRDAAGMLQEILDDIDGRP